MVEFTTSFETAQTKLNIEEVKDRLIREKTFELIMRMNKNDS